MGTRPVLEVSKPWHGWRAGRDGGSGRRDVDDGSLVTHLQYVLGLLQEPRGSPEQDPVPEAEAGSTRHWHNKWQKQGRHWGRGTETPRTIPRSTSASHLVTDLAQPCVRENVSPEGGRRPQPSAATPGLGSGRCWAQGVVWSPLWADPALGVPDEGGDSIKGHGRVFMGMGRQEKATHDTGSRRGGVSMNHDTPT